PVRHAAVGACAAWLHALGRMGALSSDAGRHVSSLETLSVTVLEVALQCGEDLGDDGLVASELSSLLEAMPGQSATAGLTGSVLSRLLVVFDRDADQGGNSACSALAAAVSLARQVARQQRYETTSVAPGSSGAAPTATAILVNQLRPSLARSFASQRLLLCHRDAALDGLELCIQCGGASGSRASPSQESPSPGILGPDLSHDALLARLFHLACGGVSADWPSGSDEAYDGASLAQPRRLARLLGWLLAEGQPPAWARAGRSGLLHADMAVCVIRRFLGTSPGKFLKDPCCDPDLPEAVLGSSTQESRAAAVGLANRLFAVCDAPLAARCGPAVLSAVAEVELQSFSGNGVDLAGSLQLLELCAAVLRGCSDAALGDPRSGFMGVCGDFQKGRSADKCADKVQATSRRCLAAAVCRLLTLRGREGTPWEAAALSEVLAALLPAIQESAERCIGADAAGCRTSFQPPSDGAGADEELLRAASEAFPAVVRQILAAISAVGPDGEGLQHRKRKFACLQDEEDQLQDSSQNLSASIANDIEYGIAKLSAALERVGSGATWLQTWLGRLSPAEAQRFAAVISASRSC
ncbi:unnamed protein product, partial [Polarella glacialis]